MGESIHHTASVLIERVVLFVQGVIIRLGMRLAYTGLILFIFTITRLHCFSPHIYIYSQPATHPTHSTTFWYFVNGGLNVARRAELKCCVVASNYFRVISNLFVGFWLLTILAVKKWRWVCYDFHPEWRTASRWSYWSCCPCQWWRPV